MKISNWMKKLSVLIFSLPFLFLTHTVFAGELNLSPASGSYSVGDTINVRVILSSPVQSANAVSGSLSFSNNLLSLTSISKSNSLVSLWAVEPSYSNSNGTVDMEGVILNGYTGSNGSILTISFKAKAIGSANIKFTNFSILANDGQGTNIGTGAGQANFSITKAVEKTNTSSLENKGKTVASIQVEELKKKDDMASFSKFLITSVGKKDNTPYKIQIDGLEYPWLNFESGIFQTPTLSKGSHVLKVSMSTVNDGTISSNVSFSINAILIPIFTEFSENIKEKEYIVIKGLADPNMDIILNLNKVVSGGEQIHNREATIKSDEKGLFTYVSEKSEVGVYEITAHSRTESGVDSGKSLPIKINVSSLSTPISKGIIDTLSFLIPIIALLVLLLVFAIWGWYKVLHYKEKMHGKLMHTKALISKSFNILDEDVDEEVKIFKKIKSLQILSEDERAFINQFKKDIEEAEKTILNDVKE
jgi:hypothetical protein